MKILQSELVLPNTDTALAITEFEQILASNSGEDPFDSAIKLLAAKLWDETETKVGRPAKFQVQASVTDTHKTVQGLYRRAIQRWPHLNGTGEELGISADHLVRAMRPLIGWRLIDSDLSSLDAALERLVAKDSKGALGQYFTPREVIRFCVEVLKPQPKDKIIDPACGSGGFLYEAIQYSNRESGSAPKCLGIDFGAKAIKVAALLAAATPHAELLVSKANSIDGREHAVNAPTEWKGFLSKQGGARTKRAQSWGTWNQLSCSLLFTNPPFAGDIDDFTILDAYESQKDSSMRKVVSREHLFLERSIHMLKPGGRLAIVLPQGLLANSSASYLRQWLLSKCRVLGVIGLHPYSFLPHTSVKTAVLFLSKPALGDSLPLKDYPIFFGVSKSPGKDTSGRRTGTNDYDALAQAFTNFLASQKFGWAGAKTPVIISAAQHETATLSEVIRTDRLDAEYYDPAARSLLRRFDTTIENRLASFVDPKIDRFKKANYSEITYLDISSVDDKTGLTFPNTVPVDEAPSRASYVVRPGDVLVSTVRPERNVVALVTPTIGNHPIASNGFCVLRSRIIQPEVLFTYCKTEAFKKILTRHSTASMYPTVTDKDVLGVPFVRPSPEVAERVTHLIRSSLKMIEQAHIQIGEAIALMNENIHGTGVTTQKELANEVREERKPYKAIRRKA